MTHQSPQSQEAIDAPLPAGSLPLRDRRREAFAQNLFAGVEVAEAYERAGFRRPRGNAQRMEREPEVAGRVAYLRRRLDETDQVDRAYRRLELRRLLRAFATIDRTAMFDEIEIERTIGRGKKARKITTRMLVMKSLGQLTADQRVLFEGLGDGGRVLMPSKLSALAQLAKLDGLDQPAKIAATDPSGQHAVPLQVVEIVRFTDAKDQAAA